MRRFPEAQLMSKGTSGETPVKNSIAPETVAKACETASRFERTLVMLDSNHTHTHILAEIEAYTPLVTLGSYCVVFDTLIEDRPAEMFPDRP